VPSQTPFRIRSAIEVTLRGEGLASWGHGVESRGLPAINHHIDALRAQIASPNASRWSGAHYKAKPDADEATIVRLAVELEELFHQRSSVFADSITGGITARTTARTPVPLATAEDVP